MAPSLEQVKELLGDFETAPLQDLKDLLQKTNAELLELFSKVGNVLLIARILEDEPMLLVFESGAHALVGASCHGHLESVQCLLQTRLRMVTQSLEVRTEVQAEETQPELTALRLAMLRFVNVECYGWTSLMTAASGGHGAVLELLTSSGAKLEIGNATGTGTALVIAAREGKLEIVQILIGCRADVDAYTNSDYCTPLMLASRAGALDMAKCLLEARANISEVDIDDCTALMHAAEFGHVELVNLLCDSGANVNAKGADRFSGGELTALAQAAGNGQLSVVRFFVETCKIDINAASKYSDTALFKAVSGDHLEIVQYLLRFRADVGGIVHHGATVVMTAAGNGNQNIINCLLQSRAQIEAVNDVGRDVLWFSVRHLSIFQYMVDIEGLSVNRQDSNGMTPLMEAALNGSDQVVEYMAQNAGSKIDAKSKIGCMYEWYSIEKLASYSPDGWTALFFAATEGDLGKVKLLLKHQADPTTVCRKQRAIEVCGDAHPEVREFLQEAMHAEAAAKDLLAEEARNDCKQQKKKNRKRGKRQIDDDPVLKSLAKSQACQSPQVHSADSPCISSGRAEETSNASLDAGSPQVLSHSEPHDKKQDFEAEHVRKLQARVSELEQLLVRGNSQFVGLQERCNVVIEEHVESDIRNQILFDENEHLKKENQKLIQWLDEVQRQHGRRIPRQQRQPSSSEQKFEDAPGFDVIKKAAEWYQDRIKARGTDFPVGQTLRVPVICLRWTHKDINAGMMFGFGGQPDESIFKMLDELQHRIKTSDDIREPLDIVQYDDKLWCMSNRRLTALLAFQSWHRDELVFARCRVRASDSAKFLESLTTLNDGLGVEIRTGESQHMGQPLFDRGKGTFVHLQEVEARHSHPASAALAEVLNHLKCRPSARELDGNSLTLTDTSNSKRFTKQRGKFSRC